MEYKISDKAKKVTIGIAIVGLVMFVIGFFQQKDFVYPKIIDDHSLTVEYSGELNPEKEAKLKEMISKSMESKGFSVEIHKLDHSHTNHTDLQHAEDHVEGNHTEEVSNHADSLQHSESHVEGDHSEGGHEHTNDETNGDIVEENVDTISEETTEDIVEENTEVVAEETTESIIYDTIDGIPFQIIKAVPDKTIDVIAEETTEIVEEETTHASDEGHHGHHGPTIWEVHISHPQSNDGENHNTHSSSEHGHSDSPSHILANMLESGEISFFDSGIRRFWSNLLINGFFFFGIALGALFYLALHYATESGWGVVLLRLMEGIMSAMPLGMGVLLVVFIAGTFEWNHIYPWMDSHIVTPPVDGETNGHFDPIIYGKTAYLNKPFFWIRVIAYFVTFYLFLRWFKKKSRLEDSEGGTKTHFKMYRRAALFLVFFAVFSTTMSWDFIMSIDTHWYSTLFGWYVFSGIWLSGMVMLMMITLYLRGQGHLPFVKESHIHDVGKWMFALSFLWSYLWFSQFMLIWYANIPEEVIYFTQRIENYKILFFGTFIVNFIFPMVFLMSADTKRSAGYLIVVGLLIFIGHWFDVYNMVTPGTLHDQWEFGLLEIGMFMSFLGTFVFLVLRAISKAPLLQKNHPYLDESKHHEF